MITTNQPFRLVRDVPARRGQQAAYDPLPHRVQGIQEQLHLERVDHAADPLLRPAAERANHIHRVGYWRPALCYSCGWVDIQAVWQEMVRRRLCLGVRDGEAANCAMV